MIGLDPTQPGDRFRFSLLHELAHLLMHRKSSRVAEDEANRFAGAALIPRSDVDQAMEERPTLSDFIALKKRWGISVAALVYRAKELQHIDERRYGRYRSRCRNGEEESRRSSTLHPVNCCRDLWRYTAGYKLSQRVLA